MHLHLPRMAPVMHPPANGAWIARVTPAAAAELFRAGALASRADSGAIELHHLEHALLTPAPGATPTRLLTALRSLSASPEIRLQESEGGTAGRSGRLPRPSEAVLAVLANAVGLAELHGEQDASTLHLYAALLDHDSMADSAADAAVTTDVLLAHAQRTASSAPVDDKAPSADPRPQPVIAGPAAYAERDRLNQRTTGRRSATVNALLKDVLPTGEHMNGPLSWNRVRYYVVATVLQYVACVVASLALVEQMLNAHAYWKLALLLPLMAQPMVFSPWLLVPSRLLAAWFAAPVAAIAILVSCVVLVFEAHAQLWLLRVSRRQPDLPVSETWRPYWRSSWQLFAGGSERGEHEKG